MSGTVHWKDLRQKVHEARKARGLSVQACAEEIGIGTSGLLKLCTFRGSTTALLAAKWLGLELVGIPESKPQCVHEWRDWMCGCSFGCDLCDLGRECIKCGKLTKNP